MGNCNNFCDPDPDTEIMKDISELKGFNRGDLNLSCQLCGEEMEHTSNYRKYHRIQKSSGLLSLWNHYIEEVGVQCGVSHLWL